VITVADLPAVAVFLPSVARRAYQAILCLVGQVGSPTCHRATTGIPPVSAGARLFRSCSFSVAVAIAGCTHDNRRVTPRRSGITLIKRGDSTLPRATPDPFVPDPRLPDAADPVACGAAIQAAGPAHRLAEAPKRTEPRVSPRSYGVSLQAAGRWRPHGGVLTCRSLS
jgi:hypothetical protein